MTSDSISIFSPSGDDKTGEPPGSVVAAAKQQTKLYPRRPWLVLAMILVAMTVFGSDAAMAAGETDRTTSFTGSSRNINHPPDRKRRKYEPPAEVIDIRSIDGSGNNSADAEMGAVLTPLDRYALPDYADGISALAGDYRPSARAISNAVSSQTGSIPNRLQASDWLWQWGQFVDHDIDLTDVALPLEPAYISVPAGDPYFDPDGTGNAVIPLNRSIYDTDTGDGAGNPRQQLNEITAWIDGSNVYGSDAVRAAALRANDGSGELLTSAGDLLPFNVDGLPNAGGASDSLFLAGDVRANEQVGLTAVHTLFVREHNRLARKYRADHPDWTGEQVYQKARQIVGAFLQAITYKEYLPALLGREAIPAYAGYDPNANGRIANEFATAAYRYGHSALNTTLLRVNKNGEEIVEGHLALRDAFFAPHRITDERGIDPVLRGLSYQKAQAVDPFIIDDVRNFLFGEPGSGGFDLAALNIQRGRDHGIPSYNAMCDALGLTSAATFADLSSDTEIVQRLASVYESVDDVDLWVGGLSEDPLNDSHVGPMMYLIIQKQFLSLRDGDRFWYERTLTGEELNMVNRTRLSDIIRRNSKIGGEIPDDVFRVIHAKDGKK